MIPTGWLPRGCRALTVGAAALLVFAMAGCGGSAGEEGLKGRFGPGTGGPALSGSTATILVTKGNGQTVGAADYDPAELILIDPVAPVQFGTLASADGTLVLSLNRIAGQPATPCRFQAAVLARDEDYTILDSGTRTNDQDLEFSQVNLKRDGTRLSFFCATLRDEVGVLIEAAADAPEKLDWVQVHHLLNTVRKQ